MKKERPLRRDEVQARALWIACEIMERAGFCIEEGELPAEARKIRRFLTGKARRELLRERRQKKEPPAPHWT